MPRKRDRRDPVRCGRAILKRLPLGRQRKHRIHLVPHLVERSWIDQTLAVTRRGRQTTLTHPATHRPWTSADPLRCLCDREHASMLRPPPDRPVGPRHWFAIGSPVRAANGRLRHGRSAPKGLSPGSASSASVTDVDADIKRAAHTLAETAGSPVRVILFGSHARGDACAGSDLAFLVIEREVPDRHAEMVRLLRLHRGTGRGVGPRRGKRCFMPRFRKVGCSSKRNEHDVADACGGSVAQVSDMRWTVYAI